MDIILTENFPQSFRFLNHAYPKLNNQPDVYINPYNPERFKTEKKNKKKTKKNKHFLLHTKLYHKLVVHLVSQSSVLFSAGPLD